MSTQRFERAIEEIDKRNARDPNTQKSGTIEVPDALLYSARMTAVLEEMYPDAGEELKIAVRAQHIERWKTPRTTYPEGRAGYHAWRNDLKRSHAQTTGQILDQVGYEPATIELVKDIVAKKNLKSDDNAQALEDVACIVFLKFYAQAFASKHASDKVQDILTKTWRKMSQHAQAHATQIELPNELQKQIDRLANPT